MSRKWAFIAGAIAVTMLGGCTRCEDQPQVGNAEQVKREQDSGRSGESDPQGELEAKILTEEQLAQAEETKKTTDDIYKSRVESFDGAAYVKPVLDRLAVEPILNRWQALAPMRDLLVTTFDRRAEQIRQALRERQTYMDLTAPLALFDNLHALHVSTLKNGDVLLAHNVLLDIMRLSYNLCGDHFRLKRIFELPENEVVLSETACQDGLIICLYITGKPMCEEPFTKISAASYEDPARTMDLYEAVLSQAKAEIETQAQKAAK